MEGLAAGLEAALDAGHFRVGTAQLEELNAALVKFRDATWALGRDRLEAARSVSALALSLGLGDAGPLRAPPPSVSSGLST